MNEEIFTVYDSAARRYLRPFHAQTIEMALRQFRAILTDPEHQFARFPEDYSLFHIGTFDSERGEVIPVIPPHSLGVAITMMPIQRGPEVMQ